ncbi:MAG: hypothetical protein ACR2GZ_10495 [Solirubrobacteraceae bacterium]
MSRAAQILQRRAEILKLARILERDPDELAYLEAVSLDALQALREQTTEVLWSANGATLSRLAAASKLLPSALTATIAQRAFGPLLVARMTGLLEPSRAVEIATKLPTGFLADVAVELDPRRASSVLELIAPEQVEAVTRELVRRREHVTMGRFVGHLGDAALKAALGVMDNETLLQVGFVLEDKARLERLISLLPKARLTGIILAAAPANLWLEALDLLGHLSVPRQNEIVAGTLELGPTAREDMVAAVVEHELWEEVVVIAQRDPTLQGKLAQRLSALPARQRKALTRRLQADGGIERLGVLGQALA